jgi:DNA-binding XRE family transcriptional regulator
MNSQKKKEKFLELRIEGETFESIASELSVSKQTLINWSKEKEIQEAIDIAQKMRIQSVLKQYQNARKDKIEYYSKLSQKVKLELLKTDISQLKPEKLLDIAIKCDNKLNDLIEGKLFGGGSVLGEWETEKPSYYFNPED